MIQYSNATGRASDLNKLMIKHLNDALEPGQPELYTQAMFKLTALLICSKGNRRFAIVWFIYSPLFSPMEASSSAHFNLLHFLLTTAL